MTYIDGIAASENIDSSGERISIAGMDISSLAIDGTFSYEHEAATGPKGEKITIKMPEQTVGKILKAKKIFQETDCEDERQSYFWKKCQTPFIYIMGELFDDYTDAARDLAGKFRYDQDRMGQNERTVCNFSIEGAYIAKEGIEVTRSVARKCTITVLPCNKAARAEMIPAQGSKSGDVDSLFKTESFIEIELFKTEPKITIVQTPPSDMQKHADLLGIAPMKKDVIPFKKPMATAAPAAPKAVAPMAPKMPASTQMGSTKSGKAIMSHTKIHEYTGFGSQDHQDAANLHHGAAQAATTPEMGRHHLDRMKLHLQAARTAEQRETRFARGKQQLLANHPINMKKTLDAGSGMAAPSQLTGGAALAKEDLVKNNDKVRGVHVSPVYPSTEKGQKGQSSAGLSVAMTRNPLSTRPHAEHLADAKKKHERVLKQIKKMPTPNLGKAEWLARAEEEYANWDKREEYKAFMKKKMPHLADGEIDAIGKTIALKKSVDAEESLSKLVSMEKSDNGQLMEKGQNGDWAKEGYAISHVKTGGQSEIKPIRPAKPHTGIEVYVHKNGKEIGKTILTHHPEHPDKLYPLELTVDQEHRRKGLASAMYQHAEKHMGKPVMQGNSSEAAKKLWGNKERPFGKK